MSKPLTLHCPAKINLALSVAPPNADGMHPIASWMIITTFGDTLTLQHTNDSSSPPLTIEWADDAPQPTPIDWPLEKDLAYRAWQLLQSETKQPLPITAHLTKRIPTGAGLGGGSSDAAAMLVGLNQRFNLNLPPQRLIELSYQLGSDVAFLTAALLHAPSALVTGLGEIITPVTSPIQPLHLVIICPPAHCPTGPVYQAFDQTLNEKPSHQLNLIRVEQLTQIADPNELNQQLFNDLAPPAQIVQPQLKELQANLQSHLNQPIHITGSGAAMFTLAANAEHAQQLTQAIKDQFDMPARACESQQA